jgi:hypothetical protein
MRMTDTPYDAAMTRSKQELARQLVDANVMVEKWEKEAEHAIGLIDALKARIEQLEERMRGADALIVLWETRATRAEARLAPPKVLLPCPVCGGEAIHAVDTLKRTVIQPALAPEQDK